MPVLVCQTELNNQKKYTISPRKNISLYRCNKNRDWNASLTVEASLVIPMFFFLVFWLWQIFLLLFFQLKVCEQVTETVLEYSHLGYIEQKVEQSEIDSAWIYELLFFSNLPPYENVKGKWIDCKMEEDGNILVEISYEFLCEAVFFPTISVPIIQKFQFYPYFGEQEETIEKEQIKQQEEVVYMTEHGTVYHMSKTCMYLNIRLKSIPVFEIEKVRNNSGQRYTECSKCKKEQKIEQVYISLGGNKYHWSLQCPSIKRTIIEKKKEEVNGILACHKCGKQDEERTE